MRYLKILRKKLKDPDWIKKIPALLQRHKWKQNYRMDLDITAFKERLAAVRERGDVKSIIAFFYEEIRQAENMKMRLTDEMNEQSRDFIVKASDNIDTYMFTIKQIEKDMQLPGLTSIQQDILQDNLQDKIMEKIEEIEALKKKYNQRGS